VKPLPPNAPQPGEPLKPAFHPNTGERWYRADDPDTPDWVAKAMDAVDLYGVPCKLTQEELSQCRCYAATRMEYIRKTKQEEKYTQFHNNPLMGIDEVNLHSTVAEFIVCSTLNTPMQPAKTDRGDGGSDTYMFHGKQSYDIDIKNTFYAGRTPQHYWRNPRDLRASIAVLVISQVHKPDEPIIYGWNWKKTLYPKCKRLEYGYWGIKTAREKTHQPWEKLVYEADQTTQAGFQWIL